MFRDFHSKTESKTECLFCNLNNFLAMNLYLPNGRVIDDLHSPNSFATRMGERASGNVLPCETVVKCQGCLKGGNLQHLFWLSMPDFSLMLSGKIACC